MLRERMTITSRRGQSSDAQARAVGECFIFLRAGLLQDEVEADVDPIALSVGDGQQTFARTEGEVGLGQRIVAEIDLCCQRAIARCLDEEVHVCWPVALTPQGVH